MKKYPLPCPFCGAPASGPTTTYFGVRNQPLNKPQWYCYCRGCGIEMPPAYAKYRALQLWNRRNGEYQ